MNSPASSYRHTQRAPLCLLLYALAAVFLATAWSVAEIPALVYLFLATGVLMVALGAAFHHLTVSDEGDRLAIAFGPLPLFRRTVRYREIASVEVARTALLDGWGIHLSTHGGWTWNLWGRDCVLLRLRRGKLRIGTDDAENLAAFLRERLGVEPEAAA